MNSIFVISSSLRGGGAERVAINLNRQFNKLGISSQLVIFQKEGDYLNLLKSEKVIFLEANRSRNAIIPLKNLINQSDNDIFISVKRDVSIALGIAKTLSHNKSSALIYREANPLNEIENFSGLKKLFFLLLLKLSYKQASKIIANSTGTKESLLMHNVCHKSKINIIGNPIIDNTKIITDKHVLVRKKIFNSNPLKKHIISAGRLEPQKNFELAIRVIEKLNSGSSTTKYFLDIYGEGSQRKILEQLIRDLNLTEYIRLLGFSNQLERELSSASVFLLTSNYEGFGNVIVEALNSGIPVCARYSDGGVRDILCSGKFVRVINDPDGDPSAYVNDIKELSHLDLSSYDRKEIQDLVSKYSIENIVQRYLQVIKSL